MAKALLKTLSYVEGSEAKDQHSEASGHKKKLCFLSHVLV